MPALTLSLAQSNLSYWLNRAVYYSRESDCERRRLGCLLLSADGQQLSAGWNSCRWPGCNRREVRSGEALERCGCIEHAEAMAIRCWWEATTEHKTPSVCVINGPTPCNLCLSLLQAVGCILIIKSEPGFYDLAGSIQLEDAKALAKHFQILVGAPSARI